MRRTRNRGVFVALATTILVIAAIGTASAAGNQAVTTRDITAGDGSLSITVQSAGDAGMSHGNLNPWTSPVDPSGDFYWFNKPVSVIDFALADVGNGTPILSGALFGLNTGAGYDPDVVFEEPYLASYDGVYSITATGNDGVVDSTGTIAPAFGIDTVDPVVMTDAAPFFSGTPQVTVTATDAMSGVENVMFDVDGAVNDVWEPDFADPSNFSVSFPFVGEGTHEMHWTAFDNAGNKTVGSETFAIDNTAPTTTSDAAATYGGAASIHLTADDGSGSGVAHTYYILDSGTQMEGTSIVVPAPVSGTVPHTLEFWSEDAVGNSEDPHVTVNFTVSAAKLPTSTTLKASAKTLTVGSYVKLTAKVLGGTFAPGTTIRFEKKLPGSSAYVLAKTVTVSSSGSATYRYKVTSKGKRYHRVRFLGTSTYLAAPLQHGLALTVK